MREGRERLRGLAARVTPPALWAGWAVIGYFLIAQLMREARVIQIQYAHASLDWIANQVEFVGQVGFLLTLAVLAAWCGGAPALVQITVGQRKRR
jgi:hypothetical protein